MQGGVSHSGNIWVLVVPLSAFYMLNARNSAVIVALFSIALLGVSILMTLAYLPRPYEIATIRVTYLVYLVIVILGFFNERQKMSSAKRGT